MLMAMAIQYVYGDDIDRRTHDVRSIHANFNEYQLVNDLGRPSRWSFENPSLNILVFSSYN